MKAVLLRTSDNGEQTNGYLSVFNAEGDFVKGFNTLELPYKNNERRISCIPAGVFRVTPRSAKESASFKYPHFHVQDVENRSWILIHVANYVHQLLGCIAVGQAGQRFDIDRDGKLDISNSGRALKELVQLCPNGFELEIINATV